MDEERKAQWVAKFEKFPLLRILLVEVWFRVAFGVFLFVIVSLALFLPKIWRVSPASFRPEVKVSGLDLVQAWSLKRSALKKMAAGKYDEAGFCWREAVANNLADPELSRGYLLNHVRNPADTTKELPSVAAQASWLLRLTGTNMASVSLVAQVYEKHRLYESLLQLLAPLENQLRAPERIARLKALFHVGQISEFAAGWENSGSQLKADPDLALYYDAYLTGWGPPEKASEARGRLQAAWENPARQAMVSRLQLAISAHLQDPDQYRRALERLDASGPDTLMEHIDYWRLLAVLGRKPEAVALAKSRLHSPRLPGEAIRLAAVYAELGMQEDAIKFLEPCLRQFGYVAEIWIVYAILLIDAKRWEDLRTVALQIRQQRQGDSSLVGYSYYLEGRADLANDRAVSAEHAFQKMRQSSWSSPRMALAAANSMIQLDRPTEARDILLKLERERESDPDYWYSLFLAALKLKETDLMHRAAARAYELRPNNRVFANNYAAVLLILRTRPDLAIKLTLRLITENPRSTIARINHCFGLVLNERVAEAAAQLATIDPRALSPLEASSFYLCQFEILFKSRQFDRAWEASDRIDRQALFPVQIQWLEETQKQMPARAVTKK